MDERITIIQHRGKDILSVDYSNMTAEEVIALNQLLPEAVEQIAELRILVDGTNARASLESMAAFREMFTLLRQGDWPESTMRAAGIGVSGLGKILFDGLGRVSPMPIRAFESRAEALDWLAE